ncbi:hypothetical protein AB0M43_38230 [Longispora sp. NPDC051575]|uniref:hypothetical protein n=1 Tax=Longispora sp. NPDC051575 TaxID=3154943 RepID=UPI00343E85B6
MKKTAKPAPAPPAPITINGYTGREPEPRYWGQDDQAARTAAHSWQAAHHHNALVEHALAEAAAVSPVTTAREEAWLAYTALSTASSADWIAAHHRWIVAEEALAVAAEHLTGVADDYERATLTVLMSDDADWLYERAVAQTGQAGLYGPDHRHRDAAHDARQVRAERKHIVAQTLNALGKLI